MLAVQLFLGFGDLDKSMQKCKSTIVGQECFFSGHRASGFVPVTLLAMAAGIYGDLRYYRTIALGEREEGEGVQVPLKALAIPFRRGDEFLRAFAVSGRIPKPNRKEKKLSVAGFDDAYRDVVKECPKDGFDKIAFRGGFSLEAEYLLLDEMNGGLHAYENANCVLELGVGGYTWVCAFDWATVTHLSETKTEFKF